MTSTCKGTDESQDFPGKGVANGQDTVTTRVVRRTKTRQQCSQSKHQILLKFSEACAVLRVSAVACATKQHSCLVDIAAFHDPCAELGITVSDNKRVCVKWNPPQKVNKQHTYIQTTAPKILIFHRNRRQSNMTSAYPAPSVFGISLD